MNRETLTIAAQFEKYLRLVKLDKNQIHPIQLLETRQAFYAAWGQLIVILENDTNDMTDQEIENMFVDMTKEVKLFFDGKI